MVRMAAPHGGARQADVKAAVDQINRQRRELEDLFRRKRTLVLRIINARAAAEAVRCAAEEKALAAAERERGAGRERAARHDLRARTGLRELRQVCASAEEVATLTGMGVGQVRAALLSALPLENGSDPDAPGEPGCIVAESEVVADASGSAASFGVAEAGSIHEETDRW